MRSVKVDKAELLEKLRENRNAHRAIFEEALKGYHKRVIKLLQKHIDRARKNKREQVYVSIPFPEDHTDDYDAIIAMVEMSLDNEIELDQQSFRQYVLDEWHWKGQFLSTNSAYSKTAAYLSQSNA